MPRTAGCDAGAHLTTTLKRHDIVSFRRVPSQAFRSACQAKLKTMPSYDFRSPRLFVEVPLIAGTIVALQSGQAHYLTTVLRLKTGAPVLVFNGRDGEWMATVEAQRRGASL